MLELLAGRRDVGVPALGHPPPRELHVALVERRLELQQEQLLLDIQDRRGHDPTTLAADAGPGVYPACAMSSQYVFTMHRLTKVHPPDKTVLDDITLAFFPGAKIGVLGYNGAGKSTLLRIMAGRRPGVPRRGDARARRDRRDARAGAAARRVQGRARQRRGRRRRDARRCSTASTSWPPTTPTRPPRSSARSRRRSTPPTRGTSTRSSTTRWTRCACRPADADVTNALRRRAPPRGALPPAAARARPAAARRAHEPPRRRVGRVAGAAPRRVQGHDRRGHPRPLLPRQRRRLDPRARPRPRHPLRGQLLQLARAEAAAPAQEERTEKARQRTIAAELEWVRRTPRAARPSRRRAWRTSRRSSRRSATSSSTRSRSTSRRRPTWAAWWSRPRTCARASATSC